MGNQSKIEGNQNIVIQGVSGSTITLNVNGKTEEIGKSLDELKSFLQSLKMQSFEYAEKIYDVNKITHELFDSLIGGLYNTFLYHEIKDHYQKIYPDSYKSVFGDGKNETKDIANKVNNLFGCIIGNQLRRIYIIGTEGQSSYKTSNYTRICTITTKIILKIVSFSIFSILWDKIKNNVKLTMSEELITKIGSHILTEKDLSIGENLELFQCLIKIFENNQNKIELPIKELKDNLKYFLEINGEFEIACNYLAEIDELDNDPKVKLNAGHTIEVEKQLCVLLKAFIFLTKFKLVSTKKIEFEYGRNSQKPRYIRNYTLLDGTDKKYEVTRFEESERNSYSVIIQNKEINKELNKEINLEINLFPFVFDFHALSAKDNVKLYIYKRLSEQSGIEYYSVDDEDDKIFSFRQVFGSLGNKNIVAGDDDEEKKNKIKQIKLDEVLLHFKIACKIILNIEKQFDVEPDIY